MNPLWPLLGVLIGQACGPIIYSWWDGRQQRKERVRVRQHFAQDWDDMTRSEKRKYEEFR